MILTVIVTGAAGFIGRAVSQRLIERGEHVVGVDSFNDYYDVELKHRRIETLRYCANFEIVELDVANATGFEDLLRAHGADRVVHLAAQAGVRYSLSNPFAYQHSNLTGHLSVLEACRRTPSVTHLVYASSSSVYGDRPIGTAGFCESDPAASPASLYAATKRSCELMSASYAHLYGFPQTGLRFFTVYGPWGRPDMAYFSFTRKILAGEPIEVFGNGLMSRDFTYIDDIVDGVVGVLDSPPSPHEHRIFNIGDSAPVGLMEMISTLEHAIGREAVKIMLPMQPGDVTSTFADVSRLRALTGYKPHVALAEGLPRFVDWYRSYYAA